MKELASTVVSLDKSTDIKTLRQQIKQETGLAVRRMDAFTLIALLAVYRATGEVTLNTRSGLYSCADYFSSDLMQSMLLDLNNQHAIKPLSFVASVGNAANYYLASAFAVTGPNIFLGSDNQGFVKSQLLAEADMQLGVIDTAIIVVWQEDEKERQCWVKIIENDGFFSERVHK
ncbi:hypothetical protein NDQ71_20220 [Pseudoalteromonas sp. KG3]|uniref:Beta-ketoacyl synthase N-terminal domain-containing protein n=1 Tax=Pseudoalteromonas prydzensis TaxID=182141 RepID=A0ABR9FL71_9GAMM|nr:MULTISPECIES: hypothetical protein [Pseudoalteromonas]MBE0457549.1 hypothetical protein [Pseudoalteromonas prydzensis]WKD26115.1 hypothetical protein NDQ71_20220 [Pseudoalteromonas sp. KG3]